jgi:hypothetical protein
VLLIDEPGTFPLGPLRLWIAMLCVWSLAGSLTQTVILSVFSKHLSARAQAQAKAGGGAKQEEGLWMGRMTAGGSLGRIVLPLMGGLIVGPFGRSGVFAAVGILKAVICAMLVRLYADLLPHS